jgi:hypothetical protein
MRRLIPALVLAGTLCACGQAASLSSGSPTPTASAGLTPASSMNLTGTVDRSQTVVCPSGEPCDPPLTAVFLVFSRAGYPDVRVKVNPDGTFATHLDPGPYTISAAPPPMRGKLMPDTVRVPAEGTITLHLTIA